MKNYLFVFIAFLMGSALSLRGAPPPTDLQGTIKYCANDSTFSKDFNIYSENSQMLYLNFWYHPVNTKEGENIPYAVTLNGVNLDIPFSNEPKWQTLTEPFLISVKAGENTLRFTNCNSIILPDIDFIRISGTKSGAIIETEEESLSLESFDLASENANELISPKLGPSAESEDLPLTISFFKVIQLEAKQGFSFTSTGNVPHIIDIFCIGRPDEENSVFGEYDSDLNQSLHWSRISRPDGSGHTATLYFTDVNFHLYPYRPNPGIYMVKVRSLNALEEGRIDITINNVKYQSQLINYVPFNIYFPRYRNICVYTKSSTGLDPMLFIEGAGATETGRIVGWNDNCGNENLRDLYGITNQQDALIYNTFSEYVYRAHVSLNRPPRPLIEPICKICVDYMPPAIQNIPQLSQATINLQEIDPNLKYEKIQIVDTSGRLIGVYYNNAVNTLPISSLPPGVYLLNLYNGNSNQVLKVTSPTNNTTL